VIFPLIIHHAILFKERVVEDGVGFRTDDLLAAQAHHEHAAASGVAIDLDDAGCAAVLHRVPVGADSLLPLFIAPHFFDLRDAGCAIFLLLLELSLLLFGYDRLSGLFDNRLKDVSQIASRESYFLLFAH
jgi:hypothetical protein